MERGALDQQNPSPPILRKSVLNPTIMGEGWGGFTFKPYQLPSLCESKCPTQNK